MAGVVEFRILGPLEIASGGHTVDVRSPRLRMLLGRLLIDANRVVTRDRLIDDLWPDATSDRAGATLRNLVFRLRRTLDDGGCPPDRLETRSEGYRLQVEAGELDASVFEEVTAAGRRLLANRQWEEASAALAEALGLWRGRPLGELADEPFARAEVARLEEARLTALEDRVDADLERGRRGELADELETLTVLHPLRERLWAQLMLALYRSGRQAEALRAFQDARHVLVTELGLEPGPALARLEASILAHDPGLDWRPEGRSAPRRRLLPPPLAASTSGPFFGRDDTLATLGAIWERAASSPSGLVLVTGDAGIGKTRLLAEFASRCHTDGVVVLFGRCDEEALVPYQPFVEAFEEYLGASPAEGREALGDERLAHLAPVVPALAASLGISSASSMSDVGTARYLLFDAAAAMIAHVGRAARVLLVIDDLHWGDAPTLLMLRHLLRAATPNLTILAAHRPVDVDSPLGRALADFHRIQRSECITLDGLDRRAIVGLVAHRTTDVQDATAQALADVVYDRSEGNPFFAGEIIRHVLDSGLDPSAVPDTIRAVIRGRLARLTDETRRTLEIASVVGSEFDLAVLARMSELHADRLGELLEEARRAAIITEVEHKPETYSFAHALVRATLYDGLTINRRMRLHRRTGETLEHLYRERLDDVAGELAHHFLRAAAAGDVRKAAAYGHRAGTQAIARRAYERAVDHLRETAAAIESVEPPDEQQLAKVLIDLARAQVATGDSAAALATALRAVALARLLAQPTLFAETALAVEDAVMVSKAFSGAPEVAMTADLLREALDGLGADELVLRTMLHARLPRVCYGQGPLDELVRPAREAVSVAEALGDPHLVAHALHGLCYAIWRPDALDERVAVATRLAAIANDAGEPNLALLGYMFSALAYLERGDLAAADVALVQLAVLAGGLRDQYSLWFPPTLRAMRALLEGRLDEAEAQGLAALTVGQQLGADWALSSFGALLFQLRREQGRLGEIEPLLATSVARFPNFPGMRASLALLYCETDRPEDAYREFEEVTARDLGDINIDCLWLATMEQLSDACAALRDTRRAMLIYRALAPRSGQVTVYGAGVVCTGSVDRALGSLASLLGRWEEAEAHFHRATETNQRLGARLMLTRTQCNHAAMLLARNGPGDEATAADFASAAFEEASRLGQVPVIERAQRLAEAAGRPVTRAP